MSPLELVDDRFEKLAEELRAARPVAPEELRQRIRALEPPPRRSFELNIRWRRVVPAVALAGLAAALGVAGLLGIVHGTHSGQRAAVAPQPGSGVAVTTPQKGSQLQQRQIAPTAENAFKSMTIPAPAQDRLQQYDASLRVRVRDQEELSKRTQAAYRLTRKLGGYVAWANYSTPVGRGDSELQVQIPIQHVQAAIAAFSAYGTLIGQRIRLKDLQQRVDTLSARIQRLRARIARLNDPRDRARLAQLLRARTSTVRQGQMASVALAMVVGKKAAAAPPSRFHRTIDDAGSVLVRELEILVYALVVAGPLLLLGLMALAAARGVRRRSDRRLLERA
ncbi:MAG TPA: DUF4349 domain-containing protein [Gaiellaceae bacterium]